MSAHEQAVAEDLFRLVEKTLRANGVMRYGVYERSNTQPALNALATLAAGYGNLVERQVGHVCDAMTEWFEGQGYNSMDAAELVAGFAAEGKKRAQVSA